MGVDWASWIERGVSCKHSYALLRVTRCGIITIVGIHCTVGVLHIL